MSIRAQSTIIGHGYSSISITYDDGGAEGIDCVFKELWKLSSFLLYCGGLLLADKKRVLLSKTRRSLCPVKITGIPGGFFLWLLEKFSAEKTLYSTLNWDPLCLCSEEFSQ